MKQKTKKTIELVNFLHHLINQKKLLKSHQLIVLAISGGQDSMSLFFIFLQLKNQWNWKLRIIYCNHLWQKDSFYTMLHLFKLAYLLNIPIYLPVTLQKILTEQKARNWRSLTFQRITGFYLFSSIIIGHSKSDRIETGLFNLFRGSSTKGVSSLKWTKVVLKEDFFKLSEIQLKQTSWFFKNFKQYLGLQIEDFKARCDVKPSVVVSTLSENVTDFNKNCYKTTKNISVKRYLLEPMRLQIDLTHNEKNENNNTNIFNYLKSKQLKMHTPLTSQTLPFGNVKKRRYLAFGSQIKDKNLKKSGLQIENFYARWLVYKSKIYMPEAKDLSVLMLEAKQKQGRKIHATPPSFCLLAQPNLFLINLSIKRKSPKFINKNSITNVIKKFLIYKVRVHFKCKLKFFEKKKELIVKKKLLLTQHHTFVISLMDTFIYTNTIRKKEKQKNNIKTKTFLTKTKVLSRLYKNEYILVRPALSLPRFDLKKVCNSWKIPLFPDQSNQNLKYQRNRIRKQILPTLRFFFNPQIDTTIFQFIEIINSEQEYMDFITARIVKEIQYKKETRVELETSFLAVLPLALRRKVMKQFLEKIMKKSLKFFDIEKLLQQVSIKRGLIRQEDTFPTKKQQKKSEIIAFDVRQSQSTIQTFKNRGFVSSLSKKENLEIKSILQKDLLVNLINKKKSIYKEYTLLFFPKIGSLFLQSQRIFFIKKKKIKTQNLKNF